MFCSDKPIKKKENDCLNRTSFSRQLAQAILSYTEKDNFTVGLYGRWGCGKTSIINMAVEEINEITKDKPLEQKPIIISFNPWNYSDCTQLISQFFQTLRITLQGETVSEKLKSVSCALGKYASILESSTYIPVVGKYLEPIKTIVSTISGITAEAVTEAPSLETQKNEIVKMLEEQEQKIIIVIDDIDRLSNEQIRLIFQLVNSLAGFPNMIYLLSFDFDVVVRALEEVQRGDGKEYLEKIVQVPFNVPETRKSLIQSVFCSKLDNILFGATPCQNFEEKYWANVFNDCISPFIQNMRDVNRILNVYNFKYGLLHNETNCVDLLALTTLQICAPAIYEWIYNNLNTLVGTCWEVAISGVEENKNRENETEKFAKVYDNPALMLQVLQTLFPKFSSNTGGYNTCSETEEDQRKNQKLAHRDKANIYFNLSLEDIQITNTQIKDIVDKYDEDAILTVCENLIQKEVFSDFLQELGVYINDIPENRLDMFFNIMIKMQTDERNEIKKTFLSPSASYLCFKCCKKILARLTSEQVEKLFITQIEDSDIDAFSIIAKMIVHIEHGYGRIGNEKSHDHLPIEESRLESVEKVISRKIEEFSEQGVIFDAHDFTSTYRMWKFIDEDAMDSYIKDNIKETSNLVKYLSFCSGEWSSSTGDEGWSFEEKYFSKYIDADDAYTKINDLKGTHTFSKMNTKYKEIAVAYYLWYNSDRVDHGVSRKNVYKLIPEWELQES